MKKAVILLSTILLITFIVYLLVVSLINQKKTTPQSFFFKSEKTEQVFKKNIDENKAKGLISSINYPLPLETEDFTVDVTQYGDKLIISKKTDAADQKIDQWLKDNNLSELKQSSSLIIADQPIYKLKGKVEQEERNYLMPTITPTSDFFSKDNPSEIAAQQIIDSLMNFTKALIEFKQMPLQYNPEDYYLNASPTPTPLFPTPTTYIYSSSPPAVYNGLAYYKQCGNGYDNYPLGQGCTICKAGCGLTSTAMILSSYVNKSYNPGFVADTYKARGYYAGCDGSHISSAKAILSSYGLKTTDYLVYAKGGVPSNMVASDFRNYIKSGWTIFALADYCSGGCGHFFWVVDIDNNDNIWAFDPAYGRYKAPPFNENSYYPFPKYRIAFGVRK